MEREGDLGNYLRFNFENAVEMIDKLTKDNNALLDKIEELEIKLYNKEMPSIKREPLQTRFAEISREAKAAMERFTTKLKKEINKDAKSKQSKRQPVWERNS